ncbi:MAG TPA: N-acetyltransferase [Gaiellales bacterium]|nr:N-acetyltransferase [Gaiellales bacterium]
MIVRTAEVSDRDAILDCVRSAFATGGRDGAEEVGIVRAIWSLGAAPPELDLVACVNGAVVGHVLGSRGRLAGRESDVIGLAPLAVMPGHQRRGIGSGLVLELIARAEVGGRPLMVVLGDPRYYGRFGFEPASRLGISYPPLSPDDPHFQARRLGRFDQSVRGEFTYSWE